MKSRILVHDGMHGEKTYVLIFDTGDEATEELLRFAREMKIHGAHFTAIGAFSKVTLGYFDWERREYLEIPVNEQVECVSFIGDIALEDGEPKIHAHMVVAKRDGSALGGHLLKACVRPTLELMLTESPAHLQRVVDSKSGLALIKL